MDIVVLGTAQDGGLPQLGCLCPQCKAAWQDPTRRRTPSSLAVVRGGDVLVLDASPDIRSQWRHVATHHFGGLAITHAHSGHIAGLSLIGKEGPAWQGPLYITPALADVVIRTAPWRAGAAGMKMVEVAPGSESTWNDVDIAFHPITHRGELSDTVAIEIIAGKRLLYLPDCDAWDATVDAATMALRTGDVLFFDATFWSDKELKHRDMAQVPHPPVKDTLPRLAALVRRGVRVYLIHFNHTNPLTGPGPERETVKAHGIRIAEEGERITL